jgi:putative transposase
MAVQFQRKQIRLSPGVYRGAYVCSVTACTESRIRVFHSPALVALAIEALTGSSRKHAVEVIAYCFMPDHLHLLLHNKGKSSLPHFMRDFKQPVGFAFKKKTGRQLWQKSYYDHILRTDEELLTTARYIFENPVRAGLAEQAIDYPSSGSLVCNRDAVMEG